MFERQLTVSIFPIFLPHGKRSYYALTTLCARPSSHLPSCLFCSSVLCAAAAVFPHSHCAFGLFQMFTHSANSHRQIRVYKRLLKCIINTQFHQHRNGNGFRNTHLYHSSALCTKHTYLFVCKTNIYKQLCGQWGQCLFIHRVETSAHRTKCHIG